MHDRRLDGETLVFGNRGSLFMYAMTWWDHSTESTWSQPWGTAIRGELEGASLTPLPGEVTTFGSWLKANPHSTVVVDETGWSHPPEGTTDEFVIGVALRESAVAFQFGAAARAGVVNGRVGEFPVALFVEGATRSIRAYIRTVAGPPFDASVEIPPVLTFVADGAGGVADAETGSSWDVTRGVAVAGRLRGAALLKAPYVTAFDWSWKDFYPATTFWPPDQLLEDTPDG